MVCVNEGANSSYMCIIRQQRSSCVQHSAPGTAQKHTTKKVVSSHGKGGPSGYLQGAASQVICAGTVHPGAYFCKEQTTRDVICVETSSPGYFCRQSRRSREKSAGAVKMQYTHSDKTVSRSAENHTFKYVCVVCKDISVYFRSVFKYMLASCVQKFCVI